MRRILLGLLIASSLSFGTFHPLHEIICRECPHQGREGECMDYAIALASRLAAHGIHGRLIFYRWNLGSFNGSHVIVAYQTEDRSRWVVDNEVAEPKRVPSDASPEQLIFLLAGNHKADVELQESLNRLSFF